MQDRVFAWRNEKFRILSDITNNQRPHLQAFYAVSEQIACWFDEKSRLGYEGGISVNKRSRTEETLCDIFGKGGCAAIILYVISHHLRMNDLGNGFDVEDAEYIRRFKEPVWFRLAYTIMLSWRVRPIERQWYTEVRKLKKYPDRLNVPSPFVPVVDYRNPPKSLQLHYSRLSESVSQITGKFGNYSTSTHRRCRKLLPRQHNIFGGLYLLIYIITLMILTM